MAAGTIGIFGTVQAAMNTPKEDKDTKAKYMKLHKSLGLLVGALVPMRLAARLSSQIPAHLPGTRLEQLAGSLSHATLYGCMTVMPASGIAMGYYFGNGVPFFNFGVYFKPESKESVNKEIGKQAFFIHKNLGQAFEYLFVAHLAATTYHIARGHAILSRMLPW